MLNTTITVPQKLEEFSPVIRGLQGAFIFLVTLLIFLGNFLIILIIARNKGLWCPNSYFLLSLAVGDLILGVEAAFALSDVLTTGPRASRCHVMGYLKSWCLTLTLYTMTAMTMDRWIHVHYPLRYHNIVTTKRVLIAILAIWLVSFILYLPYFYNVMNFMYLRYAYLCDLDLVGESHYALIITLCITVPSYAVNFICSAHMFHVARRHARQISAQERQLNRNSSTTSTASLLSTGTRMKTLLLVTGTFLVCWLPFIITHLVFVLNRGMRISPHVQFITKWLIMSTSFVNWIIYVSTDRAFRCGALWLFRAMMAKRGRCACTKRRVVIGVEDQQRSSSPSGNPETNANTADTQHDMI